MKWDAFTIFEQVLIMATVGSQLYIAINVIMKSEGAEQYVRAMSFATGFLLFLISRALHITFADMMLIAHETQGTWMMVLIGGVFPFMIGILISEVTIIALRLGTPVPIRMVLLAAAFTLSQAAYTNYVALTSKVTTLDKAFIPNLAYAIAVGMWLTFRYREVKPKPQKAGPRKPEP
jgi:hypothetical protein